MQTTHVFFLKNGVFEPDAPSSPRSDGMGGVRHGRHEPPPRGKPVSTSVHTENDRGRTRVDCLPSGGRRFAPRRGPGRGSLRPG